MMNGLMQVRPSVTFMISEPCTCCHGTGRVEALETSFSKIEHEICRLLVSMLLQFHSQKYHFLSFGVLSDDVKKS